MDWFNENVRSLNRFTSTQCQEMEERNSWATGRDRSWSSVCCYRRVRTGLQQELLRQENTDGRVWEAGTVWSFEVQCQLGVIFLIYFARVFNDSLTSFFSAGSTCMQASETNASSREGCFPWDKWDLKQIPSHAASSSYPLFHWIQARSHQVHWNGILHRNHW